MCAKGLIMYTVYLIVLHNMIHTVSWCCCLRWQRWTLAWKIPWPTTRQRSLPQASRKPWPSNLVSSSRTVVLLVRAFGSSSWRLRTIVKPMERGGEIFGATNSVGLEVPQKIASNKICFKDNSRWPGVLVHGWYGYRYIYIHNSMDTRIFWIDI